MEGELWIRVRHGTLAEYLAGHPVSGRILGWIIGIRQNINLESCQNIKYSPDVKLKEKLILCLFS